MGYCGRPRLNGLEVKRINSRKPKAIIPITASTRATASSGIRRLKMATAKVQTLSSNIDLFYTPGEIIYGKTETRALPHTGQRLRVGGYVQPGSLQRDPQTLDVRFKLYDARGVVDVSYKGILPDLFREGQGVVAQGVLDGERHITAQQVLAKHDENYTPPEVKNAMTPEKTGAQP